MKLVGDTFEYRYTHVKKNLKAVVAVDADSPVRTRSVTCFEV